MAKTKEAAPVAATKAAATKTAVAVRKASTDVGEAKDWKDELKRFAKRSTKIADETAGGGSWLTFKSGRLAYKGLEIQSNDTELLVLGEVHENLYYEDDFDPDNAASPVCYALAYEVADLAPHATSPKPQHEQCKGCPQNVFGSADRGKGKACKNILRIGALPWGDGTLTQIEKAEIAYAKIPVMSVKNWSAYRNTLTAKFGEDAPSFLFVTRLTVVPDQKSQFQVRFDLVKAVDKKLIGAIVKRAEECERELIPAVPYQPREREEKPAKGKAAKGPAKKRKF